MQRYKTSTVLKRKLKMICMKVFRFKQQPKLEKKKADNSRIYNNPEARDHPRATLMASTETKTYIFTLLLISNKKTEFRTKYRET